MTLQAPARNDQKRAAILAAALREFDARGFRETSMDRVAASAGVSKRTVYNQFASKQALFDVMAERLVEHAQQGSALPYDPQCPVGVQLRAIAAQVVDMLSDSAFQSLARVTLAELIRSPALARKTYDLFRQRQTGVADWLQAAARDRRLVIDDPVWAADQFLGLIKAFAFWPQLLGGQPAPDSNLRARIVDSTVIAFLAGQVGPPGD